MNPTSKPKPLPIARLQRRHMKDRQRKELGQFDACVAWALDALPHDRVACSFFRWEVSDQALRINWCCPRRIVELKIHVAQDDQFRIDARVVFPRCFEVQRWKFQVPRQETEFQTWLDRELAPYWHEAEDKFHYGSVALLDRPVVDRTDEGDDTGWDDEEDEEL